MKETALPALTRALISRPQKNVLRALYATMVKSSVGLSPSGLRWRLSPSVTLINDFAVISIVASFEVLSFVESHIWTTFPLSWRKGYCALTVPLHYFGELIT